METGMGMDIEVTGTVGDGDTTDGDGMG